MQGSSIIIEFGRDASPDYTFAVLQARELDGYSARFVAGLPRHTVQTRVTDAQQSGLRALLQSVRSLPGAQVTLDGRVMASNQPAAVASPPQPAPVPHAPTATSLHPVPTPTPTAAQPESVSTPTPPAAPPNRASAGLASPLDEVEYAVFDTETTGIDAKYHRVVEVAVLVLNARGEIIDEYCTLVNPNRHMDRANVEIHKVIPAMASTAPPFELVADDLLVRLAGRVWVGHNVSFDVRMLQAEFSRLGLELPPVSSICTYAHCEKAGLEKGKLTQVCQQMGLVLEASHTALCDARATAKLFQHMLTHLRKNGARTLADLGCQTPLAPAERWPQIAYEETSWTREQAVESLKERVVEAAEEITREALHGATVCLTGDFVYRSRAEAERLLLDLGVRLTGSVSRRTTYVFAADLDTGSTKARKARELGVTLLPERSLWLALGV